ncbi:MAG TPA: amino acid permease [Saprospiraceae bacterium]|nr:amino acid permease [Saprospiraceae bacterium]
MTNPQAAKQQKFGTFLGVYTPSILTILGLIMYLRFGWVVGNVGLIQTIVIVLMASSITFITGLSASAIATNIKVGVGGEYYLISRSLGLEPGGAIGIPLYLCRTLSVTFYSFGLAEAILVLWPESWGHLPPHAIQIGAMVIILLVTILSGKSAGLVLKTQIPIMIIVGASIVALIIGVLTKDIHAPILRANYSTAPQGFWYVFAVFFPAVTGFTAGVGMSGDLKDPQKSIPIGTLGAVVSGAIIYLIIPLVLSITGALTIRQLADPNAGVTIWTRLAILGPWIVYPAVWGAVLSSAFGSILGGPRILQALSMDGLAPKFLSKLSKSGQPTVATWISGVIALLAVFLGSLNTIAQYVSVLFLTLYVAINLSAAIEQLIKEPSYRPRIHVPWYISLIGAIAAIVVMILINPWAFVFAFGLELVILAYLVSKKMEQQWGDAAAGIWMRVSRFALLKLNARKIHPRNWRPILLLFVRDIKDRIDIVRFAALLGQNSGVLTISKLITPDQKEDLHSRNEVAFRMQKDLKAEGLEAFTEVNIANDFKTGMYQVAASHGIAGLKTNTVVFGWSLQDASKIQELKIINNLSRSGKNILLLHFNQPFSESKDKRIDIWWGGKDTNGDLMLLLAYLIRLNRKWEKVKINIFSKVNTTQDGDSLHKKISSAVKEARMQAHIELFVRPNDSFVPVLHEVSASADLVFLGLAHNIQDFESNARFIDTVISGLKVVAFVQNNSMENEIPVIF